MKTFKMISFQFLDDGVDIPLIDGITINQENEEKTWILELFISKKYQNIFESLKNSNKIFEVLVVITSPQNEPAPFIVSVINVEEMDENVSVLLKGTLREVRLKYAEKLLKALLEENLSKDELLEQFILGMRKRPRLKE